MSNLPPPNFSNYVFARLIFNLLSVNSALNTAAVETSSSHSLNLILWFFVHQQGLSLMAI